MILNPTKNKQTLASCGQTNLCEEGKKPSGMAAVSARRERSLKNRQVMGKTKRDGHTISEAVEHDCSVNGSVEGRWSEMDCSEGRDEENEG